MKAADRYTDFHDNNTLLCFLYPTVSAAGFPLNPHFGKGGYPPPPEADKTGGARGDY
jgi:hypothetical protein